tara:strand:+ start:1513 stop:2034 length:522 start_codon:yes stop_codon:yes gene_type:complete
LTSGSIFSKVNGVIQASILFFSFALIGLDQIAKYYALYSLIDGGIALVPHFIELNLAFNQGIAFSMLANESSIVHHLVTLFNMATIIGLMVFLFYKKHHPLTKFGLILIIAGGCGNLLDRIKLHMVIDFIQVKFFNFPLFICNLADIYVTMGALLFIYSRIFKQNERHLFSKN